MDSRYKKLFSPSKINKLELKNRIVMPPMEYMLHHARGETSDKYIEIYARRARGGAAIVICGPMFNEKPNKDYPNATAIVRVQSPRTDENPRLYELVETVKANGALICASLSPAPMGWMAYQYSIHPEDQVDEWEQTALQGMGIYNKFTTEQIKENIAEFAQMAGNMKAIGFDAIEINFSFYPDYFCIEKFNKRQDEYHYSDDPEQRLRFHKELLQATRAALGPDFPIMLLQDIDHFLPGWRTLEETIPLVKKFEEWGADSIRTRSGTSINVEYDILPQYFPKGHTAYLAAALKQVLARMPVIANAKLSDPNIAEKILEEGKADFIAMGRGLLADPELPNKVRAGEADRVRKCISCCECYHHVTMFPTRGSRCTVNPIFGLEEKFKSDIPPARTRKKVVVVGGGPAGMSAALTIAQRGHDVVLLEKSGELGGGGEFRLSTIPPFKQENLYIAEYYQKEFADLKNITVHFNTEADVKRVTQEKPDAVIIATGASALVPDMLGADDPSVLTYADVLLEKKSVGNQVVIVGGGNVGCETANYLLKKGKRVTILEMLPRLANEVNRATRNCLMRELTEGGAEMITEAEVKSISGKKVNYVKDGKELSIAGDTIVLAVGAKPENQLYKDLGDKILDLHIIGDAKEPRQIMNAVKDGFYTGYYI